MTTLPKSLVLATALCSTSLFVPAAMADHYTQTNSYTTYHHYSDPVRDACHEDEQNDKVAAGLFGAVVGGVLGSQLAGNGARSEGSAIGAAIGGLAGVGIADKHNECGYAARHGRTYSGQTYGHSYSQTPTYSSGSRTVYTSPVYKSQPVYSQPVYSEPVYSQPVYSAPVYSSTPSVVINTTPVVSRTVVSHNVVVPHRPTIVYETYNKGRSYKSRGNRGVKTVVTSNRYYH